MKTLTRIAILVVVVGVLWSSRYIFSASSKKLLGDLEQVMEVYRETKGASGPLTVLHNDAGFAYVMFPRTVTDFNDPTVAALLEQLNSDVAKRGLTLAQDSTYLRVQTNDSGDAFETMTIYGTTTSDESVYATRFLTVDTQKSRRFIANLKQRFEREIARLKTAESDRMEAERQREEARRGERLDVPSFDD